MVNKNDILVKRFDSIDDIDKEEWDSIVIIKL